MTMIDRLDDLRRCAAIVKKVESAAENVEVILNVYLNSDITDREAFPQDLIADLFHWCTLNDVDFDRAVRVGIEHATTEYEDPR